MTSDYAYVYAYYEDGITIRVLSDRSLCNDYEKYLNNYLEVTWEAKGIYLASVADCDDEEILEELADSGYLTVGDVK